MKPTHLQNRIITLLTLMLAFGPASGLWAADVTWTGGTSHGAGTVNWTTASNWDTGVVPTNTDNAILGTGGSTNAYIDFPNTATPAGIGCITLSPDLSSHNQILRQQSGSLPICVYGLNGVLVTNASAVQLQIAQSGVTAPTLYLAGNGAIGVAGTGKMLVFTGIKETNGSYGFTKTGTGTLILQTPTANTHTGPTTISEGTIDLRLSTARLGPGTVNLGGGTLLCAADRSGVTPMASPVVVTGDAAIKGNGTLANSSRIFPFSGSFGGSSGSLTIDNIGVSFNTFIVRLTGGGFTFSRPITLNSVTSTYNSYAMLQLYNAASSGSQTFSGVISSYDTGGMVQRTGADGTTIFTGANTYQGGTLISYGTLLANNTSGSALGSGAVTVTNLGTLGGSGSIVVSPNTVTVTTGGTISPGASSASITNLSIDSLTLSTGSTYLWQIASATGTPGVNWDLLTVSSWADTANSANPITIKVDSRGVTPTGWDPLTGRDWVILQNTSGSNPGLTASDFALDTTAFSGSVAGLFGLSADIGGSIHLTYTPAADIVIDVVSGTKTQAEAGHAQLTGSQGMTKVGNGELVLDNPFNDYLGSTKVLAGTVSLNMDAANGSGALGASSTATYLGNTTGNSNATFNINAAAVTMSRNIVVQSGSSGTKTIGTTLTSGTAYYMSDVALLDSAVLSAPAGSTVQFAGDFSGNGGLTLNGPGTFTMGGIGTGTYAGPTTVNTAVLNFKGAAFGTNTVTFANAITLDNTSSPAAAVTLNSCAQNWNGDIEFIGSTDLNLGSGRVTISSNRSLTIDNGTFVVGGPIAGNGGLTKRGAGALALTAATASTYTGGTTNLAGVLIVNGTATFGNGTGTLLLGGGNLLCTQSHAASPLANPVLMTADTIIYGTNQTGPTYLPFAGSFTVTSGTIKVGNKGWANTVFGLRLQGPANLSCPIIVGDPAFDRATTTNMLDFFSDTNTPAQIISSVISGPGIVRRGCVSPNTGGSTILSGLNTFTGGAQLIGGAIGFGLNSESSGGVITAGPIGTALFTIGNQTIAETNMTVFAYGGPRVIENPIFLNGAQNVVVTGTNDLTFTGPIAAGGIPKTWTVRDTGVATLAGQITSSGVDGAALTKAGSGTLVLSGDNLYVGTTTITGGKLLANNTTGSATSTNTVYVRSGATLGGTGTVAGLVSVTSGSIAPGQSAGILTVEGGVNLSSGGTYAWDLAANSTNGPGSNFDVLAVTGGSVVLDGTSQIAISFIGSATAPDASNPFWQTNHSWSILTLSGSAVNPGPTTFSNIVNGSFSAGSFTNYADASGNIILAFTPGATLSPLRPVISGAIAGVGTANPTVSWSAESGIHYQLQYKTNLNQADWLLVGAVTASGTNACCTHTNSLWPQCYYRVIVP